MSLYIPSDTTDRVLVGVAESMRRRDRQRLERSILKAKREAAKRRLHADRLAWIARGSS